MKKWFCLCAALILCVALSACNSVTYPIDREALEQVVNVELIEYDNPSQSEFTDWNAGRFYSLLPFDATSVTVLETLPYDEIPAFLDAFAETDILMNHYVYDSPKDICLRLTYANGNYLIIWSNYEGQNLIGYIGEYTIDGDVASYWGFFSRVSEFEKLVAKFFDYSLT